MITVGKCERCNETFVFGNKAHWQRFCSAYCRHKQWTDNNRDKLNSQVRKYRAKRYKEEGSWWDAGTKAKELKQWMIELKSKPCTDCGNTYDTCCMEFDHIIDSGKEYNLGSMFSHHYSKELIQTELDKCELVCSNCHRIRTRNKRQGNGKYGVRGVSQNVPA